MPNNIAVIGDSDFISGFGALGCSLYSVDDKSDLRSVFSQVIEAKFSFIFILENCAAKIMDLIEAYQEKAHPLITVLPDFRRDLDLSKNLLGRLAVKAVGKDISEDITYGA